MKFIKNQLQNKTGDEFLGECMIIHLRRDFATSKVNESIIEEFHSIKHRAQLREQVTACVLSLS